MDRQSYYTSPEAGEQQGWNGICVYCGHTYFACRGNCTCLSCNAQRQTEIEHGLWFEEDGAQDESNTEYVEAQQLRTRKSSLTKLRQWRKSHALTQAEAAVLFGVHHITYTRWETGKRTMDGATMRLAQVLQTPQGMRLVQRLAKEHNDAVRRKG